jgi:hypothetical protein
MTARRDNSVRARPTRTHASGRHANLGDRPGRARALIGARSALIR